MKILIADDEPVSRHMLRGFLIKAQIVTLRRVTTTIACHQTAASERTTSMP